MLLGEPPRSTGDLQFVLFGIPVRIHPWFWIITLLFGLNDRTPDMREMVVQLVIWAAAVFFAILVHELGHAFAFRAHGFSPYITLYGMGGLTSYLPGLSRRLGTWSEIFISAAGPLAGFLLAASIVTPAILAGKEVIHGWFGPLLLLDIQDTIASPAVTDFLNYVIYISVVWGTVNLMPIYPLDGGQIARELLMHFNPRDGLRQSLWLSCFTAAGIALVGLVRLRSLFVVLLFGYFAFASFQALQQLRGRGW